MLIKILKKTLKRVQGDNLLSVQDDRKLSVLGENKLSVQNDKILIESVSRGKSRAVKFLSLKD